MFGSTDNAAAAARLKDVKRTAGKLLAEREKLEAKLDRLQEEQAEAQRQVSLADQALEQAAARVRLGEAEPSSLSALEHEPKKALQELRGFRGAQVELKRRIAGISEALMKSLEPAAQMLRSLLQSEIAARTAAVEKALRKLGDELVRLRSLQRATPAKMRGEVDAAVTRFDVVVGGTGLLHMPPSGPRVLGQDASEVLEAETERLRDVLGGAQALVDQLMATTADTREAQERERAEAARAAEANRGPVGTYVRLENGTMVLANSREGVEHQQRELAAQREADEEKREAAARSRRRWSEHPAPVIRSGESA